MSDKKDSILDIISVIIFFIIIGVEISLAIFSLFAGGGAESETNLKIFTISAILGILGGLLILLLKLGQFIATGKLYNKIGWIGTIFHDPEDSILPKKIKSFIKNPFVLALLFIIPSSILGMIQIYQNTFLTALPSAVPQQITETAQGFLSTIPSDMEIFLPLAFLGLFIIWIKWLVKINKLDKGISYILIYLVAPILYGFIWMANHKFHHGASTIALSYVFLFGLISAYLTVIFSSIIPAWIFKITNNLYQWLNGFIQADEKILMITIIINAVVILSFIGIITLRATRNAKIKS